MAYVKISFLLPEGVPLTLRKPHTEGLELGSVRAGSRVLWEFYSFRVKPGAAEGSVLEHFMGKLTAKSQEYAKLGLADGYKIRWFKGNSEYPFDRPDLRCWVLHNGVSCRHVSCAREETQAKAHLCDVGGFQWEVFNRVLSSLHKCNDVELLRWLAEARLSEQVSYWRWAASKIDMLVPQDPARLYFIPHAHEHF